MKLLEGNTKWVLFLSGEKDAEDRHVLDLAFGLLCLESVGVSEKDIFIYIDGKDRASIGGWIASGSSRTNIVIKESADYFSDQDENLHENMVMFITGHGSLHGISANPTISPSKLLLSIKSAPNLKQAIVYLGQCFAGIFNYIGAGQKNGGEPQVIFIGATNLHESLSSPTQENMVSGSVTWPANVFLLHVFKWISAPVDIDGDGKMTVIDSYKYAGVMSNTGNKRVKVQHLHDSFVLHKRCSDAIELHKADPSPINRLALDAILTQYEDVLQICHVHQECWILNAIPAQSIEF